MGVGYSIYVLDIGMSLLIGYGFILVGGGGVGEVVLYMAYTGMCC